MASNSKDPAWIRDSGKKIVMMENTPVYSITFLRLTSAEMMGSTFTISNLGMYGIGSFTAIINPPESAILAVGKMVDTPVAHEGQIVLRPMIELTACADHRISDSATVARFLADLKAALENPYLLI